jgi:two-component system LytT family response regulator
MKTLIVEDEPLARKELRFLLGSHPEISVIGEAISPTEALRLISELQPELLFLDVHLRGGTGFDLLDACELPKPRVIFTTAHPDFAAQAFDFAAVDYLVKPIRPERLAQAISRVLGEGDAANTSTPSSVERLDRSARILLKNPDVSRYVPVADITLIESEGNHSRIHFGNESVVIHRALTSVEERLPGDLFFRASRAQVINLEAISKVEPWFSNCLRATLRDGTVVEFSRRASHTFRDTHGL